MIKVLHITPSFFPATAFGGPIYSTLHLCKELATRPDVEVTVATTNTSGPRTGDRLSREQIPGEMTLGFRVIYFPKWKGADVSLSMLTALPKLIRDCDVIHLTAVYSFPTIPTLFLARTYGKPVAWSPRGSLQMWEGRSKPMIKTFWNALCKVLASTRCLVMHFTTEKEAVESAYFVPQATNVIVPNGVESNPHQPERNWRPGGILRVGFIGRLHPVKGLETLLRAVSLAIKSGIACRLDIYGTGESSYVRSLGDLAIELQINDHVIFRGPVNDAQRDQALSEMDLFILPSITENFGIVAAEALAAGVPVVASDGTPWKELSNVGCGDCVARTPEAFAAAIEKMAQSDVASMGAIGRKWMAADYSWTAVASKMFDVYSLLVKRTH